MPTVFHTYRPESDFDRIGRFLVDTYRTSGGHINWLQQRWECMHFHRLIRQIDLRATPSTSTATLLQMQEVLDREAAMVFRRLGQLIRGSLGGEDQDQGETTREAKPRPKIADPRCPYCGFEFDPPPARQRKCPSCGETVYVRTRPADRQRVLATAEQVEAMKKEREAERRKKSDVAWADLNKKLHEAMGRSDWHEMNMLYFQQALQLFEEGRAHLRIAQESRKAALRRYQADGMNSVEILTAGDESCPSCQALQGKRLTVEEALAEMPIPNPTCTMWKDEGQEAGWCRCLYVAVID